MEINRREYLFRIVPKWESVYFIFLPAMGLGLLKLLAERKNG